MPHTPDPDQTSGHDVIVVGNGALGSSAAVELARRGASVALIGRTHRPYAASTAAGAMLGCFGEVTTALVDNEYGRLKFDLDLKAKDIWPEWLEGISGGASDGRDILTATGTTVLLNSVGTAGIDSGNFHAIRSMLEKHDEPYETVDPADVAWLDPDPNSRPLQALHIPSEHAVDSGRLLLRLERTARDLGVTLVDGHATSVISEGGRARGVVLENGERLLAGQVLLAGGVGTQDLVDSVPALGDCIPRLVAGYGVSALVTTQDGTQPDSVIRTPNRAFACGLHIVPRGAGRVYVGATNIVSPRPLADPVMRDILFLLECSHRQTRRNLWTSTVVGVNVGNRPISLDGFPLLGETPLSGLWMMTGTYRDGLFLSPLLAQEFGRRMSGETPRLDLDPFTPERPPLQGVSRRAIVDTTVEHTLATGYEQHWQVPTDWQEFFDVALKPAYDAWAEELDPEFTPQPDLLAASRTEPLLTKWLRAYYENCRARFPRTARRPRSAGDLIDDAAGLLAAARVPKPRADALALAAHAMPGHDQDGGADEPLPEKETEAFRSLVARRAEREPLEYLLGRVRFFDLELEVGEGAYIPRRRTEAMVTEALARCTAERPRVVDLCTGSGAVALAVGALRPGSTVTGVDNSAPALRWAERNRSGLASRVGSDVDFVEGDVTDERLLADLGGRVDLVTAVPPNVPDRVQLVPELSDHQPRAALRAGWDGLDTVRSVVTAAARLLTPGGVLAVEHHDALADAVADIVRSAGFESVTSHTDGDGHPRFLIARRASA
ncbi:MULTISPECIES: FAD-dependent oxidoreductase [Streptomyces]|uniref:Modification methylase n=2 Tax=Streptomyces TaxID=1883 RepID=A0A117IX88_9ACTN|nr:MULTISPECIES: FAD-dependent oxidoreductase [Streptomyces]KUH39575.1 modification methylase [Streptomyces kanasensis]UUS34098.1 HemK family protein methyltransferase [Streptomyces changanensis]